MTRRPAFPTGLGLMVDAALAGVAAAAIAAFEPPRPSSHGEALLASPSMVVLGIALALLALRLAVRLQASAPWRRPRPADAGSVTVSFVLCLPLFLMVVSIAVQLALICNAQVVVNHAAYAAARSAATLLPDGVPDADRRIRNAAAMTLAGVSPAGQSPHAGRRSRDVLHRAGADIDRRYAARLGYALSPQATTLSVSPSSGLHRRGPTDITVDVRYRLLLTVPYAAALLSESRTTVDGVSGRYLELHGRSIHRGASGRDLLAPGVNL